MLLLPGKQLLSSKESVEKAKATGNVVPACGQE